MTLFAFQFNKSVICSFPISSSLFLLLLSYPKLRMMQINNAGSNAYSYKPLAETSDEDLLYAFKNHSYSLFLIIIIISITTNFVENKLLCLFVDIFTVVYFLYCLCSEVITTNSLGLMICCREVSIFFFFGGTFRLILMLSY